MAWPCLKAKGKPESNCSAILKLALACGWIGHSLKPCKAIMLLHSIKLVNLMLARPWLKANPTGIKFTQFVKFVFGFKPQPIEN